MGFPNGQQQNGRQNQGNQRTQQPRYEDDDQGGQQGDFDDQGGGGQGGQKQEAWRTFQYWTGTGTIFVKVWLNQKGEKGSFSVTWNKSYKDRQSGKYLQSKSLFVAEIPCLILGMQEAFLAIHHEQTRQ